MSPSDKPHPVTPSGPRPRQPKTSEVVARELADTILRGELAEGVRLPPEHEMLTQLNVSRATLREALRLLETRGVITVKAGRQGGPIVRRPRAQDLSEALTLILQFEDAVVLDVIQARLAIGPTIAALAAERIDDETAAEIGGVIDAMFADLDDNEKFLRHSQTFHALIARASGNPVLIIFTETLKAIADRAVAHTTTTIERRRTVAKAHRKAAERLAARDVAGAEAAMRDYFQDAARYWSKHYGPIVQQSVRWTH